MRFAYADPPYYGYGKFYDGHHDQPRQYDDLDAHRRLIEMLAADFPDGWALSMTSGNLHDILPLCPRQARIAAWIKPFASFKVNVSPAYAWEPVVFMRTRKHTRDQPTARDFLAEPITLQRGLTGAKPARFNRWVLDLLGFVEGDEVIDLFPGTGSMAAALARPVLL